MTKQRTCPHCGARLKVPSYDDERPMFTDFFCVKCDRNYTRSDSSPSGLVCTECGRPEAAT